MKCSGVPRAKWQASRGCNAAAWQLLNLQASMTCDKDEKVHLGLGSPMGLGRHCPALTNQLEPAPYMSDRADLSTKFYN